MESQQETICDRFLGRSALMSHGPQAYWSAWLVDLRYQSGSPALINASINSARSFGDLTHGGGTAVDRRHAGA